MSAQSGHCERTPRAGAPRPSQLGDCLRALAALEPLDAQAATAIVRSVGLPLRAPAVEASTLGPRDTPIEEEEPIEPELPHRSGALRLVSDEESLPPARDAALDLVSGGGEAPPEWLSYASLMPMPERVPTPFRGARLPLFEPKWQRAIIVRLASTLQPAGEIDLAAVVERIASARPIHEVPRRHIATALKGVRLLVDQGESMQPFQRDVADLARAFRRTLGSSRLRVEGFRGLPSWGVTTGIDAAEYRAAPATMAVVVVSDLGLAPQGQTDPRVHLADWVAFFAREHRAGYRATAVVPRDAVSLPAALSLHANAVAWDRRTLASRIALTGAVQPQADAEPAAAELPARAVALNSLAALDAATRDLACACALAARVEPALLRTLRMRLLPQAGVEVEARLWFSALVAERAATGIVLQPDSRDQLLRRLRFDAAMLEGAWTIIAAAHVEAPPAVRMEEEATYRWLSGDLEAAREILRRMVATVVAPQRSGTWRWASQAVARLPRALMAIEEAQMLALGAAVRSGESAALHTLKPGTGAAWHWLRPKGREIELAVTLRRGTIEFAPVYRGAAMLLRVPDSNPVFIDIVADTEDAAVERVRLNPQRRTLVAIAGDAFDLHVVGGAQYRLKERGEEARVGTEQRFIARNRAPRVQIEYAVELYGSEKKIQLPFVTGVMSDLSGGSAAQLPPLIERKFQSIDIDSFDAVLKSIGPRVAFKIADVLVGSGEIDVDIAFESMEDFSPGRLARHIEPLARTLDSREGLRDLVSYAEGKSEAEELLARVMAEPSRVLSTVPGEFSNPTSPDDFTKLLLRTFIPRSLAAREGLEQGIRTLAWFASEHRELVEGDVLASIGHMVAALDARLSQQLNLVLHHPDFQRLEGAWRGLHYLVLNSETDGLLKISVLNVGKQELSRVMRRYTGDAFDQSPLFKKIVEHEFGILGGEPFGCLVGDYEFDHSTSDVQLLAGLARIASTAFTPFIAAASPHVLQMETWQQLAERRDLPKLFTQREYAGFNALRESDDARWVALTMPRFLARVPYGSTTNPVEEFAFEEDVPTAEPHHFTWANAAYAMAANVHRAFSRYGWCARIRGAESGGGVEGLPTFRFPGDDGGAAFECGTEVGITDRRESELSRSGFLPLMSRRGTDLAMFMSTQTLNSPRVYDNEDATTAAMLGARLPYLFAIARFTHHLKCIVRDRIGSYMDRDSLQRWLQAWLSNYVDPDPANSSDSVKARLPLASADVVIEELEGSPGAMSAKIYLRPHYQLEGLTTSLRVVTRLPSVFA